MTPKKIATSQQCNPTPYKHPQPLKVVDTKYFLGKEPGFHKVVSWINKRGHTGALWATLSEIRLAQWVLDRSSKPTTARAELLRGPILPGRLFDSLECAQFQASRVSSWESNHWAPTPKPRGDNKTKGLKPHTMPQNSAQSYTQDHCGNTVCRHHFLEPSGQSLETRLKNS